MARASGDPNNMHTLSWGGGTTGKDPFIVSLLLWNNLNADSVTVHYAHFLDKIC